MSTLNLGKIRFNWTGAYNNSTAYVANDVVSSGGNSYICKLASTGNAVSNGTYWDLMSQAGTNGTNGTDLGTVLTTQGDIVFRDGSGLQRLAKGTASQVLAINSGATAPEWVAAAGGASERLTGGTFAAASAADITHAKFDMDIANDTEYSGYRLWASWETNNNAVKYQIKASQECGSSWASSNYSLNCNGRKGGGDTFDSQSSDSRWDLMGITSDNNPSSRMHMTLDMIKCRDESANNFCGILTYAWHVGVNGDSATGTMCLRQTMSDLDGLRLQAASGTIDGCWDLYGIKSS